MVLKWRFNVAAHVGTLKSQYLWENYRIWSTFFCKIGTAKRETEIRNVRASQADVVKRQIAPCWDVDLTSKPKTSRLKWHCAYDNWGSDSQWCLAFLVIDSAMKKFITLITHTENSLGQNAIDRKKQTKQFSLADSIRFVFIWRRLAD